MVKPEKRGLTEAAETENVIRRMELYMEDISAGRIIACKKVQAAVRRQVRDLRRSETDPDWPWEFDPVLAARPVRFMERFLAPMKGDYDHMELLGWQVFALCCMFGWVHRTTRLRRFREALILVGRGNGKSTLMSGVSSFLCCKDGERGADVYLLANTKEQASIVYEEARHQILNSPALSRRFRPLRDGLYYDATASRIQHRASDSKRLDGLAPHGAVFDEIHGYRDFSLINVIKRGANKRKQPMLVYITTMGTVLDGPLAQYYGLFADAMEEGVLSDAVSDRLFAFMAELDEGDDIEDSTLWIKANPSMGVLLEPDTLRADWERSRNVPQERSDFINKQLNIMTDVGDAGYVDIDIINRNREQVEEAQLVGQPCYAGYDLSTREDFTAAALLYPLPDGRVYVKQHSWCTARKAALDQEKIPYYEWQLQGHLTIVETDYIPDTAVFDWLKRQRELGHDIQSVGYDPANAVRLNQQLIAASFNTEIVRQGALTLSDPLKEIRTFMLDGRLVINDSPMMRWYLSNVRLRRARQDEDQGNWVPTKRNRHRKIDGFAAMLDAWVVWVRSGVVPEEEPDILTYQYHRTGG